MRLRHMLRKEFVQFSRNPVLLRMAILLPLLQTFVLSYAANLDVTHVPVTVCDEDHSPESRDLLAKIDSTPYLDLKLRRLGPDLLEDDLARGHAVLALHLPPHFSRDLLRGTATVQILVDGAESSTSAVAASYLQQTIAAYDRSVRVETAAKRGLLRRMPTLDVRSRVWFNPDLRSLWFMAPGVMAMILTILMQNLTALSIARERELGTLEQLVMTPIRPSELLLAKLAPFFVVGCLDACVVTALVRFWFQVPLRGSIPTLALALVVFLFAVLGLGLLVSSFASNQQQAQLVNFFLSFPAVLLSGFIFPVRNLPDFLRPFSYAVPMTHLLDVIRGVFLRGSGIASLWPSLVWLAGLAAVFFTAGARRFRKRLD